MLVRDFDARSRNISDPCRHDSAGRNRARLAEWPSSTARFVLPARVRPLCLELTGSRSPGVAGSQDRRRREPAHLVPVSVHRHHLQPDRQVSIERGEGGGGGGRRAREKEGGRARARASDSERAGERM